MPLRDDLLNPIPGENPSGANLRYAPVYDKIKEARREDDDAPQGEWARERKVADWKQVIKLAGEALATKSKDLQLAAWLTEAMLRTEGFAGSAGRAETLTGPASRTSGTLSIRKSKTATRRCAPHRSIGWARPQAADKPERSHSARKCAWLR